MRICKKIFVLFLMFSFSFSIYSVKTKRIELTNFKEIQRGKLNGVIVNNKGEISLGPVVKTFPKPESEFYLSLDTNRDGDVFLGTGHLGTVYKIDKNNKVSKIFSSKEPDVYSVLSLKDKEILIATSPGGKIFKVNKKGKSSVFFNPEEKFIWDLKRHFNGNIYCATGNSGSVYQIDASGNGRKIFTSDDSHIMKLYISKNGAIYAGSGNNGILYKIVNRKTKVVFDSPLQEISGISEDAYGNIYFSANKGNKNNTGANYAGKLSLALNKIKRKGSAIREKSILYKMDTAGIVKQVWASTDEAIYSVAYDSNRKGVMFATGQSGRLYLLKDDESFSILYESDSSQIFRIIQGNSGFFLLNNNTASIIKIENKLTRTGYYLSEVFDLNFLSRFGMAYWGLSASDNSRVLVYVRAGNTSSPNSTWLTWGAPYSDGKGAKIDISGYRYAQVKIVLNTEDPTNSPAFRNFRLFTLPSNIEPKIQYIKIERKKKKILIKFKAVDPNKDKLIYNVYLKKLNTKKWILFKKNYRKSIVAIDNELFENGEYILKIVVNDSLENPPHLVKTAVDISKPFIIDSTAPELVNFTKKGTGIAFEVKDDVSIISTVLYSYDGLKEWTPIFPADMICDSKIEKYTVKLRQKSSKTVFIKIIDEAGNYKIYQKEL